MRSRMYSKMGRIMTKVKENGQLVRVEVKYDKRAEGWKVFVKGKGIEETLGVFFGEDLAYSLADELEEEIDDMGYIFRD